MLRILDSSQAGRLFARRATRLSAAEDVVRPILEAVRKSGDKALLEYARRFDNLDRKTVRVSIQELEDAANRLTPAFCSAVDVAAENVRRFAEHQLPSEYTGTFPPGLELGQIVRPLDTVGAYIPAGRYPLPSTVIMTAVPALTAGVANVCIACPKAVDEVYGTALMLGVHQVFRMGGAQA